MVPATFFYLIGRAITKGKINMNFLSSYWAECEFEFNFTYALPLTLIVILSSKNQFDLLEISNSPNAHRSVFFGVDPVVRWVETPTKSIFSTI